MSDQEKIQKALRRAMLCVTTLKTETGRLVDPPDFRRCYSALDDLESEIHDVFVVLQDWEEEEENG